MHPILKFTIMMKIFFSVLAFCIAVTVQAQKISGTILKEGGDAAVAATIALQRASDSATVKYATINKNGSFTIAEPAPGNYLVKISHVGYVTNYTAVTANGTDIELPKITLSRQPAELASVTVTTVKPVVEVKADKTILNVEGTINAAGNDGLELLRRAPGVMVDKDDNISVAGKNGVSIYIDGKPSPLSGSDLANYLKTLQSSQMESIEIITNPSAKYEAAGNAGIINIKLKKNKTFGTNGSLNAGINQGTHTRAFGGLNLNNRNKYMNIFGSYNIYSGKSEMEMNSIKNQLDTLFDQRNKMSFQNTSHNFKVGADYFINKRSTLGAVVSGNFSDIQINSNGPMYFTEISSQNLVRILEASSINKMPRNNVSGNLNYRNVSAAGSELNIDADYGHYKIRSNQIQPNTYFQPDGVTQISKSVIQLIAPTDIDLYSVKADYEQNYKGGKLGYGAKSSYVTTANDFQQLTETHTGYIRDTGRSNTFGYKENINALYVNYNKQLKKGIMVQAGLRAENTVSKGHSTGFKNAGGLWQPYDSSFKRSYLGFFPSAAVTFNKNPMSQYTVTYSRRIDRPAYQDLNPFEFRLNEYAYRKGNTTLRPQYTNSFGLTHIYKYKLTTSINYSFVKDIFAQVPDTIDKTKGFMTKKNLATQNVFSLNISYPFQYKWYSFFTTMNSSYSMYKADFGGGNRNIDLKVFALTYFMQNAFKLGKGWTAELSGQYFSPSVWQGTIKSRGMGYVDAGFQKTVLKNKGNLKVSMSDIFKTMKWGGTSDFAGVKSEFTGHGEMPQLKINFNYRFGNSQVKAARQRKSAAEEESKRTQQSSGMGGQ